MRRAAIALSIACLAVALIPAAASARGPQKYDSVNGHGFVVFDPTTRYDFRVSAHTLSSTTTAGTGNMYLQINMSDATGTTTIGVWADVFCVVTLGIEGEVRGHIYRTEPDLLTEPTDLTFLVTDLNPASSAPDEFGWSTEAVGEPCPVTTVIDELPVAKGDITVNDEGP